MYLEVASIGPERIQYHPAGPPSGKREPNQCPTLPRVDWRDPITDREGFRLPGFYSIIRLGQSDETNWWRGRDGAW